MPITRESIITVLRSINGSIPDGLTFGEFGFAGANRQLFIGGTGGGATVQSIWIGASITGDDIANAGTWTVGGTGAYRVSTSEAVKKYVDAQFAAAGTITAVNGDTGAITITGAGNNAAVVVKRTGSGTHIIDARIAGTSVTGVAAFNTSQFSVSAPGVVSLLNGSTFDVRDSLDAKESVALGGTLTLTASPLGAIRTTVSSPSSGNATVVFDARVATASLTGVASFPSSFFTVSATGAVNLASAYQVTGDTVVQGGPSQLFTRSGNTVTIDNRVATASVTGVASFPASFFTVSTTGAVNLASAYQVTGDTVVQGGASQLFTRSGNTVTIDNRIATTTGVTGVASFDSNFSVTNTGVVSLATDVTIAGNLTVGGDVVTANVSNFTVEDTLIKLGTGNNTPGAIKDLGFYMQYPVASTDIRLAGFFLDYEDTKFKLFTGLTTGAQDGLSGTDVAARLNTDRQGYTVATLIAKLDGGTF